MDGDGEGGKDMSSMLGPGYQRTCPSGYPAKRVCVSSVPRMKLAWGQRLVLIAVGARYGTDTTICRCAVAESRRLNQARHG